MNNKHAQFFFLFCLVAAIAMVFSIIRPFLATLALAGVFAFIFEPLFDRFVRLTRGRNSVSAILVTLVSIIIVIIPVFFLGTMIAKEATGLYRSLSGDGSSVFNGIEGVLADLKRIFPFLGGVELDLGGYAKQALAALAQNVGVIFSSFAKIFLNLFVFLIAFYFFLKDGRQFSNYLVDLSPLDDKDDRFIISRLESAVRATVKGSLTIGLIQGLLVGIGFTIFGVPNPVLWGCVAAIAALLPGVGTALVVIPAVIYLLFMGDTFDSFGLIAWGMIAVGLVDNLLGPKLVGRGMQLHPLAVFVSVLGGITFFGPLGFIFGPLSFSICVALLEIYFSLKVRETA